MSEERTIRCDGCGTVKREGNKWLAGKMKVDYGNFVASLSQFDGSLSYKDIPTFCGVPCALRKIQELLEQMMQR